MAIDRPLFSVFPTCVGVIPTKPEIEVMAMGIPHMRGGDPVFAVKLWLYPRYSPHAWG